MANIGIPCKLMHEAEGHIVTIELKNGEMYRGKLLEVIIYGKISFLRDQHYNMEDNDGEMGCENLGFNHCTSFFLFFFFFYYYLSITHTHSLSFSPPSSSPPSL